MDYDCRFATLARVFKHCEGSLKRKRRSTVILILVLILLATLSNLDLDGSD